MLPRGLSASMEDGQGGACDEGGQLGDARCEGEKVSVCVRERVIHVGGRETVRLSGEDGEREREGRDTCESGRCEQNNWVQLEDVGLLVEGEGRAF